MEQFELDFFILTIIIYYYYYHYYFIIIITIIIIVIIFIIITLLLSIVIIFIVLLFLVYYESKWLEDCPQQFKPQFYRRYVDDIFLMFKVRLSSFRKFLPNKVFPSLVGKNIIICLFAV